MSSVLKEQKEGLITYSECPWCASPNISAFIRADDRSGKGSPFTIFECQDCSFHFTQNVPDPEHIAPYYDFQEYISHSDTQSSLTDKLYHSVREYMLSRKFRLIKKYHHGNHQRILDYGSGTGYFLNKMASKGWEVSGVEIDDDARELSIKNFKVTVQAPHQFSASSETYDVITLWHVLEHLYDFKEKIQDFHDWLRPGGLLVLALPNHLSLDAKILGKDWAAYDVPRHLWHFNPAIIKQMAKKYNFKFIGSHNMPMDAFYVSILSNQILKNNFTAVIKGAFVGLISNLNSMIFPGKSSSHIYVLRKT